MKDSFVAPDLQILSSGKWAMTGVFNGDDRGANLANWGRIYFTKSLDQGRTWQPITLFKKGLYPHLAQGKNDLLLFYDEGADNMALRNWPEDVWAENPKDRNRSWPGRGVLTLIRSPDEGKTWSKPQVIVNDKQIIQCRSCLTKDGKTWLVYVKSDPDAPDTHRTSLWLTSSSDDGKTWAKPQQITDGKTLDREPDIIEHDGKLLIAFSRSGRGINTNIWLATVDLKP